MIDETAAEIEEMRTHSSSAVAVKAARALEELLDREFATVDEYLRALERNSSALRRANPSHATLVTTQRDVVSSVEDADPASVSAAKEATAAAIERVVAAVETAKEDAAEAFADRLDDGTALLTHDYSSTVLGGVERAAADGCSLTAYVTEARPRMIGRKTARELARLDGVDVHLVVDGASGHFMPELDEVAVGMDCVVDGTLYNRVGTYPLAATCADAGVPFTVVGASSKVVDGGFRFENDYRATSEVMREPPEGFSVENPAYDATPLRLVDYLVTEAGVTADPG